MSKWLNVLCLLVFSGLASLSLLFLIKLEKNNEYDFVAEDFNSLVNTMCRFD